VFFLYHLPGQEDGYKIKTFHGVTTQIAIISSALEKFGTDLGRYPTREEGLKILVLPSEKIEKWHGPYVEIETVNGKFFKGDITKDVWGTNFVYIPPSNNKKWYELYSYGQNRHDDFGERDDITTWKPIDHRYYKSDSYPIESNIYNIYILLFLITSIAIIIYHLFLRNK
jgi:type II secretion system protein G